MSHWNLNMFCVMLDVLKLFMAYPGCLVALCWYFRILFLRSFPVGCHMNIGPILKLWGCGYLKLKVIWALHITSESFMHLEHYKYRCTCSVMGHPIFQFIHDGLPNWSLPSWIGHGGLQNWPMWLLDLL